MMAGAGAVMGGMMGQKAGEINSMNQQTRNENSAKRMTDYNMKKQLELWEKTGYGAQVEQMNKAGVNPAMMYGSAGSGGSTQVATSNGSPMESPTNAMMAGASLGSGIAQMEANLELTKSQKENVEADTVNKQVDTQKKTEEATGLLWENESKQKTNTDGTTGYDVARATERAQLAKTTQEKEKMIADVENKEEELRIMLKNAETQEARAKAQTEIERFKAEIEAMYQGTDKVTGRMLNEILDDVNRLTEQKEAREARRRRVK